MGYSPIIQDFSGNFCIEKGAVDNLPRTYWADLAEAEKEGN
jgi:hypothetical protein